MKTEKLRMRTNTFPWRQIAAAGLLLAAIIGLSGCSLPQAVQKNAVLVLPERAMRPPAGAGVRRCSG